MGTKGTLRPHITTAMTVGTLEIEFDLAKRRIIEIADAAEQNATRAPHGDARAGYGPIA